MADENGGDSQDLVSVLLDEAHSYGLKIAFLIEPYANLTVINNEYSACLLSIGCPNLGPLTCEFV